MKRKRKRNKITMKDWDDLRKELIKDAKKHKKLFEFSAYIQNTLSSTYVKLHKDMI